MMNSSRRGQNLWQNAPRLGIFENFPGDLTQLLLF